MNGKIRMNSIEAKRSWYRNIYLRSQRWHFLKNQYLNIHCFCCENDWQKKELEGYDKEGWEWLELHHTSYKNLNTEKEKNDLITICSLCHDEIHWMIACKYSKLNNAHLILKGM